MTRGSIPADTVQSVHVVVDGDADKDVLVRLVDVSAPSAADSASEVSCPVPRTGPEYPHSSAFSMVSSMKRTPESRARAAFSARMLMLKDNTPPGICVVSRCSFPRRLRATPASCSMGQLPPSDEATVTPGCPVDELWP